MKKALWIFHFLLFFLATASTAQVSSSPVLPDTSFSRTIIESWLDSSEQYKKIKNYPEALRMAQKAVKKGEEDFGYNHLLYAKCLHVLGANYFSMQGFKQAETHISQALRIRIENLGENNDRSAKTMSLLASTYWALGKYKEAEDIYKNLLVVLKDLHGEAHHSYIDNLKNLGGINGMMGRYKKAEPYFLKANDLYVKTVGVEHNDYLTNLRGLALLYTRLGDNDKAENMFLEVKNTRAKILGTDHAGYGESLYDLGGLYLKYGQYEESEDYLKKAMPIYEKSYGTEHSQYALLIQNLARAYAMQQRYDEAEPHFLEAKTINEKIFGKEHKRYSVSINHLGTLYMKTNRFDKAEPLLLESLSIREKLYGKESPFYFYVLIELGNLYLDTHKFDLAEQYFKKAEKLSIKYFGDTHEETVVNLVNLAKLYFEMEQPDPAINYFSKLLNVTRKQRTRKAKYLSQNEMLSFMDKFQIGDDLVHEFNHLYPNPELLKSAFNSHLLYKGFLLDQSMKLNKEMAHAPIETREKFTHWKSELKELARQYSLPIAQQTTVDSLESVTKFLEREIVREISSDKQYLNDVDWAAIRGQLQPSDVLIDIFQYRRTNEPDEVYYSAFLIQPNQSAPKLIPLTNTADIGSLKATRSLYAPEKGLSKSIWSAIAPYLKNVKRIYYSPDGLFHRINFGALAATGGKTIADKFEIRQLGNARQLLSPSGEVFKGTEAVVFGDINYEIGGEPLLLENVDNQATAEEGFNSSIFRQYQNDHWESLQWTGLEAEKITAVLQGAGTKVTTKTGTAATEEAFKELGTPNDMTPSPSLIHLATHGYFFPEPKNGAKTGFQSTEHPMIRSGLILAGANKTWKGNTPKTGEDGILTAYEIAQLDLSGTELVVLSACETGLGDIEGSEGVFGLQRAFKLAGAKYILMSLWSVNDKKAYEFMTSFYEKLTAGKPVPEAYRLAQIEMQQKNALPFNPRNWAGFILIE
ncbi:MAG: CHAT domain-containing tetratricopeptide repeat protein [Bacteroidota bacterium]